MNRITTDTAVQDLFGTGRDGFTDGDAGTGVATTRLNAAFFNTVQEEIARCVEGDGETLAADEYTQLDDAVQRAATRSVQGLDRFRILRGLTFELTDGSRVVLFDAGEYTFEGRRYVITDAKLIAADCDFFTCPVSQDTYFFMAPEDPDAPSTPPARDTIYVEQISVANGAAAPATPVGTALFAMIVTDATEATDVTYFDRGPALSYNGGGITVRAPQPTSGSGAVPSVLSAAVVPLFGQTAPFEGEDLGSLDTPNVARPTNRSFFNTVHSRRRRLRSEIDTTHPFAMVEDFTFFGTSVGGGVGAAALSVQGQTLDQANYPDGTVVRMVAHVVATDATDPTDSYSATVYGHAAIDAGVWASVTSTVVNETSGGEAISQADFAVVGGVLQLSLTGHSTDDLRWFGEIKLVILGPVTP